MHGDEHPEQTPARAMRLPPACVWLVAATLIVVTGHAILRAHAAPPAARTVWDGVFTDALTRLPVELSSFAWQAERSDAQIADAIRNGVAATAMPASRDLQESDVNALVAHVRALSLDDVPAPPADSTNARAMASGVACSESVSTSRDLEISQFWQNLQARLHPAVPNDSTADPGRK